MPVTETHIALAEALLNIEAAMRNLQLWQEQAPSPEALASTQPFAVDTLTFTQWLQFLFIPRLRQLAESGGPLPGQLRYCPYGGGEFSRPESGGRFADCGTAPDRPASYTLIYSLQLEPPRLKV